MAGKLHAGARAGTPLRCPRGPGSLQGAHTQPTPRDRPRQGTSLDLFPFSRARGGAFRPERLALPGGDCGTRAERGGAPRTSPGGVPLRPGQGGSSRDAPGWLTRQRAPGPARGAPCPRRNHGFAPRLQSGAGAEAILSEAPEPAAERMGWWH